MLDRPQSHASFAFVDAGRTFDCCVETPNRPDADAWWWFRVSSEARHRFAPFRAAPNDTADLVRDRILAYYAEMLVRRAEPPVSRWRRKPIVPTAPTLPVLPTLPLADAS